MRIYNISIALLEKGETIEKKELFVLDNNEDPREFADMVYGSMEIDILRFDAEEVDQKNLRVSKNAVAPYMKRYFNKN